MRIRLADLMAYKHAIDQQRARALDGLAAQAPPLSSADQAMGLPALRTDLLNQLDKAELDARKGSKGQTGAAANLVQASFRVVLLAIALAYGFTAAAQPSAL